MWSAIPIIYLIWGCHTKSTVWKLISHTLYQLPLVMDTELTWCTSCLVWGASVEFIPQVTCHTLWHIRSHAELYIPEAIEDRQFSWPSPHCMPLNLYTIQSIFSSSFPDCWKAGIVTPCSLQPFSINYQVLNKWCLIRWLLSFVVSQGFW